jgi:DNA invertase Pin-like site-specific DNA recombinase
MKTVNNVAFRPHLPGAAFNACMSDVALYPRLSSADYKGGMLIDESRSITNQKTRMMQFCEARGWSVSSIQYDQDDGCTGVNFERDGFIALMNDIYAGKVKCVVVVDLSRLGREYLECGRYRQIFKDYGVRFIAIDDNHDSNNDIGKGLNIEVPIKELFNEYYPAQVSVKVRATKQMLGSQGKFCNSRPAYGYQKSDKDKHVLVVDENVRHNVERIFALYLSGVSARKIADIFNREGILAPNMYYYNLVGKPNPYPDSLWSSGTISGIIKNPVYYGLMCNGKRAVRSYKNKKIDIMPIENWYIVPNTHEAIISQDRWEQAQTIKFKNKKGVRKSTNNAEHNIFMGMLRCGCCDGNMTYKLRKNKTVPDVASFRCSMWIQQGNKVCRANETEYSIIYKAVLADIKQYAVLAEQDEQALIDQILKTNSDFTAKSLKQLKKNIRDVKNRIRQIDKIFDSAYADKVAEVITETRFKRMTNGLEEEQAELLGRVGALEAELNQKKLTEHDLTAWVNRVKECLQLEELTRALVVELIDYIEVSDVSAVNEKGTSARNCYDITIHYKFGIKTVKKEIEPTFTSSSISVA